MDPYSNYYYYGGYTYPLPEYPYSYYSPYYYPSASSYGTMPFSNVQWYVDWKDMAPGLSKDWWQFPTVAPPGPSLPPPPETAPWAQPHVGWKETPNSYAYMLDAPGVRKEEIMRVESYRVLQIWWDQPRVCSCGDTWHDKWRVVERYTGRFLRLIHLPGDADENEISLAVENGVLIVTVPKKSAAASKQPEKKPVAATCAVKQAEEEPVTTVAKEASDDEDDFVMV